MNVCIRVITARQEGLMYIETDGKKTCVGRWSFQERHEARSMSEISVTICVWPRQKGISEQMLNFLQRLRASLRLTHFSAHLVRMLDQEAECSFLVRTARARNVYEQFLGRLSGDHFLNIIQNALPKKSD